MVSGVPPMGRPSGCSPSTAAANCSCDDVARVVVVHRELFEDDAALGLELVGVEPRGGDHVGDDVDRHRQVGVEHPRVVAGVLLAGGGVGLATDGVERLGDVHRGAPRGALEQQVLEEVRRAVVAVGLVARADADPGADGRRAQAGHVLGEHPDPAGQDGTTHDGVAVLPDGLLGCPADPGGRAGGPAARQASTGSVAPSAGVGGLGALLDDRVQRQLAARVDLADLDLDLLADGQDVLDVLDALAADELADLRDVQQAVLARARAR